MLNKEIVKRIESGRSSLIPYIVYQKYLDYLNKEEEELNKLIIKRIESCNLINNRYLNSLNQEEVEIIFSDPYSNFRKNLSKALENKDSWKKE